MTITPREKVRIKVVWALCIALVGFSEVILAQPSPAALTPDSLKTISTEDEFKAEFLTIPCKNKERLVAVKALFERMGVKPEDLQIKKYKEAENLIVQLNSAAPEKVIVGAHYDFTGGGSCGAVDNWTGIVAIAHLYRSLKALPLNKSYIFVAFGNEEKGLFGSRAMLEEILGANSQDQYCLMCNFDSLGMNVPQIDIDISTPSLILFAGEVAVRTGIPLRRLSVPNTTSDSAPFMLKGIPAMSLSSLNQKASSVLHTKNDQSDQVVASSVLQTYRLALAILLEADVLDCRSFREVKK